MAHFKMIVCLIITSLLGLCQGTYQDNEVLSPLPIEQARPQYARLLALLVPPSNQMCPDHTQCSDGTCCKTATGYGCCSYLHAVCCPDKLHCCPQGTVCSAGNTCKPKVDTLMESRSLSNFESPPAERSGSNMLCPDHSQCGGTCCKAASGYGCCPYENGTCCSDELTCCPHGYVCDDTTSSCRSRVESVDGLVISEVGLQQLKMPTEVEVNQTCPDHTQCSGTCCKTPGGYGCCPFSHGVCCSDQKHCCPQGKTCDVATSTCKGPGETYGDTVFAEVGFQELQINRVVRTNVLCPDHHTECNGTCCKTSSAYGCCPLQHAVCCSDQLHCCPQGSTCDLSTGSCRRKEEEEDSSGALIITESGLQELEMPKDSQEDRFCPDHKTQCNGTCCRSRQGQYSCCPLSHGVCCADQKHCCPSGTTCDPTSKRCQKSEDGTDVTEMKETVIKKASTVCPGEHYQCDETCCWNNITSSWSCCEYKNAVCCHYGDLCCAEGSQCDVQHNRCINSETTRLKFVLMPSTIIVPEFNSVNATDFIDDANDVVCPSGASCPDECTCCLQDGGAYGCCGFRNAVCCSDRKHCCPSGTVCDLERERCGDDREALMEDVSDESVEEPAITVPGGIVCPGAEVSCPDGWTCCSTGQGDYACCPLPDAACCPDQQHCCSEGMHCDPTGGTCSDKSNNKTPWVAKVPALQLTVDDNVCPDNSTCTEAQTCCQNPGQQTYNCCPYPDGVCCKTAVHCCSKDHRCTQKGKCKHKHHH